MINLTLFSQLKNRDLHAVSAEEAILDLLHFTPLKRLVRLTKWAIQMPVPDTATAEAQLKTILDTTYYLINPNKEMYRINALPAISAPPQAHIHYIAVASTHQNHSNLIQKITSKSRIPVSEIQKYTLWITVTDPCGLTHAQMGEKLATEIIVLSSRNTGILMNPIHETWQFLDPTPFLKP